MQLPGTADTFHKHGRDRVDHTPASALAAGDIVNLGGCVFGCVDTAIAANRMGGLAMPQAGIRWARKATATVFAVGDEVWWDGSASLAVAPALTADGSADYPLGICVAAAGNGPNGVAYLPFEVFDRYNVIRPIVYEFDCDGDNGDTDEHALIPAWMNRHGLLFRGAFALISEVMAGSSEDQGIVTVEDEDDNALCTLTASDAAADALNDVIVGTNDIFSATSGDAAKVIAAGKAVQGFVSQQTSGGTPAGKMKVYLDCVPLV